MIIPNLLHYGGPAIVIDPKGENFAVTARYRRSLGHEIILLDPFSAVSDDLLTLYGIPRSSLNPFEVSQLSSARLGRADIDAGAQLLAESLSGGQASTTEPFWDTSAKKLLSGLICHEMELSVQQGRAPNLDELVRLLFADDSVYAIAQMLEGQSPSEFVLRTLGGSFLGLPDQTRGGILATAQTYLSTLLSRTVLPWLRSGQRSLDYFQSAARYTLYLVIPPNKLDSHAPLLRIWITALMYSIMERRVHAPHRTLFILDECANLGQLDVLKKAVTLLRGYGLQVWMFFQDLAQLEFRYLLESETLINNCGVLQTFGMPRHSAAETLSEKIGGYDAEDLEQIDKSNAVLSVAGSPTQIVRRIRYYDDDAFRGRYDPNPLIRPSPPTTGGAASRLVHPAAWPHSPTPEEDD